MAIKNIIESHAKEKAYKKYPISIIKDSLEVRKFHEIARIGFIEGFMMAMTGYDEIDNIDQLKEEYDKLKQSRDTWEDIANNLRSDLELKINQLLRIKNIIEAYNDEAMNLFDQSNVLSGNNRDETLSEARTIKKIIEDLNLVFDGNDS